MTIASRTANQGAPIPRLEARLKVTGEARYSADMPLANLAFAVLVTSSIAKGKVRTVDMDAARRVPGVLDILSYGDADHLKPLRFGDSGSTTLQPLQQRAILHDGQIIALVVAETLEAAEEAANAVRAEYEEEPASSTIGSPGTETIPAVGNTEKMRDDPSVGDFEAEFRAAPVALDVEYATAPQHHNAIELFSTTAVWEGNRVTIYEPSQGLYGMRQQIADQLGLEPADVRVVSSYVGGAFGGKGPTTPRSALVALAAKRLGRPVRCVVTRKQACTTQPYRAETRHHVRMCAGRDGRLTGYSHEGWELTSRTDNYVTGGTEETARLYAYGAVSTKVHLVKADRQTPAYMRAPHEVPYCFALECAMDEMAEKVGLDPVEFRRRNDTITDPVTGAPYTTRSLMQCFDAAAAAFGWSARAPKPRSMRDGDWMIGYGCAGASYPSNLAPAAARISLASSGRVTVQSAVHEIGTGTCTVLAQMAAERLGIDVTAVEVQFGDTALPAAPLAGGSVTTASVGCAVLMACDRIRGRLFRAVVETDGPLKGCDPAALDLRGNAIVAAGNISQPLEAVFEAARIGAMEEYAEFIPPGNNPTSVTALRRGAALIEFGSRNRSKIMFALGAQFVEIRVHVRTGEIRVGRMVGAFAGGRIINPRTARAQLLGGMIWGIGAGLLETTEVDTRNGRYVNPDLHDYLVPVNADIGASDVLLVSETDTEVNPAGVKGLGEIGVCGMNAAIANAAYHATGKRVRKAPVRIEDLIG